MAELPTLQQRVTQHYTQATGGDVLTAVLDALKTAGTDVSGPLRYADMGSIDHFHGGALAATRALAQLGQLAAGERVLDMGGGLGGPARTLAAEYGCRVTVVDPTEPFIEAGRALTERVGLQDAIEFFVGSSLAVPFADESYDVVWTQNASMNIADKAGLVAEQRRVLRPGGRLVFQEIFAGPGGDLLCPVPWARDPSTSFLVPPEQVRTLLRQAGFAEHAWHPVVPEQPVSSPEQPRSVPAQPSSSAGTAPSSTGAAASVRSAAAVVHGPDAALMEASSRRNQAEQRVSYLRAVFVKN
jgi:ubiquinone/menaquinone biosynthesis C-methylase UbiE